MRTKVGVIIIPALFARKINIPDFRIVHCVYICISGANRDRKKIYLTEDKGICQWLL